MLKVPNQVPVRHVLLGLTASLPLLPASLAPLVLTPSSSGVLFVLPAQLEPFRYHRRQLARIAPLELLVRRPDCRRAQYAPPVIFRSRVHLFVRLALLVITRRILEVDYALLVL